MTQTVTSGELQHHPSSPHRQIAHPGSFLFYLTHNLAWTNRNILPCRIVFPPFVVFFNLKLYPFRWLNLDKTWQFKYADIVTVLLMVLATVYPKKYAHGFVVLCFVVVMQSCIMNSHEVFIHIHQGCFAGTRAIVRLPQCQWSKPDGYGKISQCITTTMHSKAKTVCILLGVCCMLLCLW